VDLHHSSFKGTYRPDAAAIIAEAQRPGEHMRKVAKSHRPGDGMQSIMQTGGNKTPVHVDSGLEAAYSAGTDEARSVPGTDQMDHFQADHGGAGCGIGCQAIHA
jgi:hypothetical protein